jgi:single-strand DNA-binding protein
MSINRAILMGNLGKDPELRYTSSQMAICSFSIATNERKKDAQSGQWVDHTEWHNIVVFGKVAENCGKYLKKGRQALIEGSIRNRKWQDKEGKDRYTTEIIAQNVVFVGGGRDAGASSGMEMDQSAPSSFGGAPSSGRDLVESLPSAESLTSGSTSSFNSDDIPF